MALTSWKLDDKLNSDSFAAVNDQKEAGLVIRWTNHLSSIPRLLPRSTNPGWSISILRGIVTCTEDLITSISAAALNNTLPDCLILLALETGSATGAGADWDIGVEEGVKEGAAGAGARAVVIGWGVGWKLSAA